jgi:hypothetical protein
MRSAEDGAAVITEDADMLNGTRVLTELVSPWVGSGRVVCADFPTFQACKQLNNYYRRDLSLLGL